MEHRLPGNLNVSFEGVEGDALLVALPDLAVSPVSACNRTVRRGATCSRLSGPAGTGAIGGAVWARTVHDGEEVDYAAARVIESVHKLRGQRP